MVAEAVGVDARQVEAQREAVLGADGVHGHARGRARADAGIAVPHWVQKAAGGVERWQVGHRICPGRGVDIPPQGT